MNDENINTEKPDKARCRTCNEPVASDAPNFPFCSERCKLVDLGNWFDGNYTISRDIKDSDIETVD